MLSLRVAQVAIALFALGHGLGMLQGRFRDDAEKAAIEGLRAYRFDIMGVRRSHHDFYLGMGHSLTLFLVFAAALVQWLIPLGASDPRGVQPILAALCAVFAVMTAFCVRWFFPAPLVLSAVAAVALGWAAWGVA